MSGCWLCDACNPCWCHWCNGRAGVHGTEAVALYRQEVEAYERATASGAGMAMAEAEDARESA